MRRQGAAAFACEGVRIAASFGVSRGGLIPLGLLIVIHDLVIRIVYVAADGGSVAACGAVKSREIGALLRLAVYLLADGV